MMVSHSRPLWILWGLLGGTFSFFSLPLGRPGALARRDRVRDPGAAAAVGGGAFDRDAAGFEPQRDRALPPAVDPVHHRDLRAALKPRPDLRDDRVDRVTRHREPVLGG